ncbi:ZinT/AdcA family metal-binding protein [Tateyamaria sp. syn59]|uniref:ZinT family metal-binding protein n=1 Tax=Tateyamaria sp. syn59 TaxID=2576942 RepID=UPI0011BF59D8|nr:ZinT/AdcA family metal-binding protein [Tateyamaria sp. syn59]
MQHTFSKTAGMLAVSALFALSSQAMAQTTTDTDHSHDHSHDEQAEELYLIDEADVRARDLSDWAGDWQSVYPYLMDGTLDAVMEHKADHGDQTAEEYRAYYEIGYKTDVERIVIDGEDVTFFRNGEPTRGQYEADGYEILTYESGHQGIRFIFEKAGGDDAAPQFIQFSDHEMVPTQVDHYHLYWGEDRAALLEDVTNWPTYYASGLSGDELVAKMIAH